MTSFNRSPKYLSKRSVLEFLFGTCKTWKSTLTQRSVVRRRYPLPSLLALALLVLSLVQVCLSATPDPAAPRNAEVGMPVLKNYSAKEYNGGP